MKINRNSEDMVNHPSHYQSANGLEVIEVIEAFVEDLKGAEAFCIANAIKYLCRFNKKNGVEDLEKAKWYIEKAIEYRKRHEKKAAKGATNPNESDGPFVGDAISMVRVANKSKASDVRVITNVVELQHYTSMIKDFKDKHLLINFETKAEADTFINRIRVGVDKNGAFTLGELFDLCANFSAEAAEKVTNHYGNARGGALWTSADDIHVDDIYIHEDSSATVSIEYPTIHANKED